MSNKLHNITDEEKILRKGFESGVAMAYFSLENMEPEKVKQLVSTLDDETIKKLKDQLYDEFVNIYKHHVNKNAWNIPSIIR